MTGNITRLYSVAQGYIRKQINYLKIPIFGKLPKKISPFYPHPRTKQSTHSRSCSASLLPDPVLAVSLRCLRHLAGPMMGLRPIDAISPSSTTIPPPSPCTFHQVHSNLPGKPPHTEALHETPGTRYTYWERYNRYPR